MKKSTLDKKAWKLFSEIRRREDAWKRGDGDNVPCVTCGNWKHWKEMDAGHYADLGKMYGAGKFQAEAVHNQCKKCNYYENGNQHLYHQFMLTNYGEDKTLYLASLKHKTAGYTHNDYLLLIEEFKKKLKRYT